MAAGKWEGNPRQEKAREKERQNVCTNPVPNSGRPLNNTGPGQTANGPAKEKRTEIWAVN